MVHRISDNQNIVTFHILVFGVASIEKLQDASETAKECLSFASYSSHCRLSKRESLVPRKLWRLHSAIGYNAFPNL
jgi:hypothetical protein